MARKAYIGVNGVARKIKKGYVGVDGVARRIKKAYIGVGGVARPCWGGSGDLEYYGKITDLSVSRHKLAATSVGNYALFGGGYASSTWSETATVDAYDDSLTRSTPTALSEARERLAATTVGNYALFAGGYTNLNATNTVDAYNTSLTKHNNVEMLNDTRYYLATTHTNNYAVFGGGCYDTLTATYSMSIVETYDTSLTHRKRSNLSQPRHSLSAATVGNYVLFAGGQGTGDTPYCCDTVDAYDTSSFTQSIAPKLNEAKYKLAATTTGDYALFGGGWNDSQYFSTVDVYNKSLTKTYHSIYPSYNLAATTIGKYVIFGAGTKGSGNSTSNEFVIFDTSLTTQFVLTASDCRLNVAEATTVGDYAIFAGSSLSGVPLAFYYDKII